MSKDLKVKVDFSDTEDRVTILPGKYITKIKDVTKEKGAKAPYFKWVLQITSGKCRGLQLNHITSLSPNALFTLRNFLVALGIKVPKSAVVISPEKFVGQTIGVEVEMREYEGKDYPNVKGVFSAKTEPDVVAVDSTTDEEDEISMSLE